LPVVTVEGAGACGGGPANSSKIHTDLWKTIQIAPAVLLAAGFETKTGWSARWGSGHRQTIVIVSHSDPIKLAVAFYIGQPLDLFQRIVIQPASITELEFSAFTPRLLRTNDCAHLPPEPKTEEGEQSKDQPVAEAVEKEVR
jgi:hypothetical protein